MPCLCSSSRAWSFSSAEEDAGSNLRLTLSFSVVIVNPISFWWNCWMRSRSLRIRADLVCMVIGNWWRSRIWRSLRVSWCFCSMGW